ncbi:MAG: signal peptidase I [Thermodesulfovibrionales bacterium]
MEDKKKLLWEYIKAVLTALVLALIIRAFVIQAFTIPSGSMIPTLLVGDYILVNKFLLGSPIDLPFTNINLFRMPGLRRPHKGDVIVFKFPVDPSKDFIKRVVAVEGDKIEARDKIIYVNGVPANEPFMRHTDNLVLPNRDNFGPIEIPKDKFFCMGDNRDNSRDSREWGFVDIKDVKGKALIVYFSKDTSYPLLRVDKVRFDRIGRLIR